MGWLRNRTIPSRSTGSSMGSDSTRPPSLDQGCSGFITLNENPRPLATALRNDSIELVEKAMGGLMPAAASTPVK